MSEAKVVTPVFIWVRRLRALEPIERPALLEEMALDETRRVVLALLTAQDEIDARPESSGLP